MYGEMPSMAIGEEAVNSMIDRMLAKPFQHPWIKQFWADRFQSLQFERSPWTPLEGSLSGKKVAMVTTGGVHAASEVPFDMSDRDGDPSFRLFGSNSGADELTITHDYYDHTDGDRDINIIVPLKALRSCVERGIVGSLSRDFFGFMGHIRGDHIGTLINRSCRELIRLLRQDLVDVVLLAPA